VRAAVVAAAFAAALLPGALGAQGLTAPDDWTWRLDAPQREVTGQDVAPGEWRYVQMPPGWHITTTEQGAILFPKGRSVEGRWAIEAELFLFPDPSDAPLGIVVEAADAPEGAMQLRFLMRRDGQAAVWARHGDVDSLLVPWHADTAVSGHPGAGVIKYVLRVTHEAETLAFAINGREMVAFPTHGEDHPALPGLRLGPGLNVHVSRFDLVTPLAPVRRR
jgi:hypothetical protein